MRKSEALKIRTNIETGAQSIPDENALETVSLFPVWRTGTAYAVDYRVRHNDILYRCVTAHESQETWTPDVSPSLWAKVLVEDGKILRSEVIDTNGSGHGALAGFLVVQRVEQPDSTNAYSKGDKVTHNGQVWISDMDGNVWEPGVYGWSVVTQQ